MRKYNFKINDKSIKCVDFIGLIDQYNFILEELHNKRYKTIVMQENEVDDKWWGNHSLQETIDGMFYGFESSTEYFMNNIEQSKYCSDKDNGLYMSDNGIVYDMGSVLAGIPECCLDFGLPNPTPYIKIMVDLSFPSYFSQTQIYNRGLAVLALIQTLILSGCLVDLYMFELNIQSDMTIMYTNKVDINFLSIAHLAFLCSTEYFRRIGFITTECIRKRSSEVGCGRGDLPQFVIDKIKKDKIFYVGGGYTDSELCNQLDIVDDAIECLLSKFNKFCIENKLSLSFNFKKKSENERN